MVLRDLLEMANDIPEGMTMEEVLELPVVCYNEFGEMVDACECETGINIMEMDDEDDNQDTTIVFTILPHDFEADEERLAQLN